MKTVRQTISLPKDLADFAETQAEKRAESSASEPNLSEYFRTLIIKDRAESKPKEARKLAA